ncbi:hypothetical protein F4677DRAFT_446023 [Hypoxylon crocopeplum]|nr:hypothetical protein F4677DRAFT_446023 [Hypoxylon crocopeplum]
MSHLANLLAGSSSLKQDSKSQAKSPAKLPAKPPTRKLPSPASSHLAHRPEPAQRVSRFRPSCTHMTMTRLYDFHFVTFDPLDESFIKELKVRPRGPESRSDKLSFLKEVTDEQLRSYTPDQIHIILAQREHVLNVAQKASSAIKPPPGFDDLRSKKPWVPSEWDECQFKCCQTCRPSAEGRSYLSLDGIVKGDIPSTEAVSFGFHRVGTTRPIIHPDRVKNIGTTAVPWPRVYPSLPMPHVPCWNYLSLISEHRSKAVQVRSIESTTPEELQRSKHTPDSRKENTMLAASLTPLPPPTPEEQASLRKCTTQMMKEEIEEGRFHKEPLEVDHGMAILEENVGLALPDVITQV